jgi:hypothetical protein
MALMTLNWLVYGEDPYTNDFTVEIDPNKNINLLKKAINDDLNRNVTARELNLFKVDIPRTIDTRENVIYLCTQVGIRDVGGSEMTGGSLSTISDYFVQQPVLTNLHILVELPTNLPVAFGN